MNQQHTAASTTQALTDEQIIAVRKAVPFTPGGPYSDTIAFARALLAASTVEPPTLGDLYYFQSALDRKDALLRELRESLLAMLGGDVALHIDNAIAAITKELEQPK